MQKHTEQLQRLKDPAVAAGERADYALHLLQTQTSRQVVQAALSVLAEHPKPDARPLLLDRYAYYNTNTLKRDAAGPLRTLILRGLRGLVLPEDVPLLEQAVLTYERLPPNFSEEAQELRAAALLALNEVDDRLARFHAVRLLHDPFTARMSGEPALTAARVLAVQDEVLPLYAYVIGAEAPVVEVLSECLKHLTSIPLSILTALVARFQTWEDETAQVGLFDLVISHPEGPALADFVAGFLADTRQYDLYRYVVVALVLSHSDFWRTLLRQTLALESDAGRLEHALDALSLVAGQPGVDELNEAVLLKLRKLK